MCCYTMPYIYILILPILVIYHFVHLNADMVWWKKMYFSYYLDSVYEDERVDKVFLLSCIKQDQ